MGAHFYYSQVEQIRRQKNGAGILNWTLKAVTIRCRVGGVPTRFLLSPPDPVQFELCLVLNLHNESLHQFILNGRPSKMV